MARFVATETGFTVLEAARFCTSRPGGQNGARVRVHDRRRRHRDPRQRACAKQRPASCRSRSRTAARRSGTATSSSRFTRTRRTASPGSRRSCDSREPTARVLLSETRPAFHRRPRSVGTAWRRRPVPLRGRVRRRSADERFYGLGQHQHGLLDQKGAVIDLVQRNTEVSIPFALSSRGYGFLWNMPGVGRVELGTNGTRWVARGAHQIDYWVTTGPTPAAIVGHYSQVTGLPPMLPEWASGFWQSKLRYRDQEELLEVAREYKRRGLPLSVIVCDYFHWTRQGEWRFDSGRVARSAGDGGRAARARRRADGLGLAHGQPEQRELRRNGPQRPARARA